MRAFEDLFIETKIKRRSVKECTDRDNLFELGEKRYIYTTDEEFKLLNKQKYYGIFDELSQDDIQDIFSTIYYLDVCRYSNKFNESYDVGSFEIKIDYYNIYKINIRNKKEFVLEISCDIEVVADFAQNLVFREGGSYDFLYKRHNGSWDFKGIDNLKEEDNLIKWTKQYIAANLDDTFIEICNNSEVDDAYLVYSMETIGSKIMPFNYFSELYDLVKS